MQRAHVKLVTVEKAVRETELAVTKPLELPLESE